MYVSISREVWEIVSPPKTFTFSWHEAPHVNGPESHDFPTTDMGLPMSMDQFPDALTWASTCQWTKNSIFSDHWHGAPHVNGPISRQLTWDPHVSGPKIPYFQTTDMGLLMSMDQFPNALTCGSPCQWTKSSIFSYHWHGAPHVKALIYRRPYGKYSKYA